MKTRLGQAPTPTRAPHPAKVAQPKTPHPAKLAQPKAAPLAQRATALNLVRPISHGDIPQASLLVDDDVTPAEGQIRKTAFLSALRAAVTQVAQQVLVSVGQSARDCPYIPYWFAYYDDMRAEHIERAILKYAPKANGAKTYRTYIDCIAAQVRAGFEANVKTGSLAGVPQGIPRDLELRVAAQAKMRARTIQMCLGEKSSEKAKSDAIEKSLKEAGEELRNWKRYVGVTTTDEIVFRKLSRVDVFDATSDERYRPIQSLNWKQNEALDGISLSRNPYFGMDVVRTGNNKVCYACVIPAGEAYDLEAAYIGALNGLPMEYGGTSDVTAYTWTNQRHNVLSQEITAERVWEKNIIGWVTRKDDALQYTKNPKRDNGINIMTLASYPRFQVWVTLLNAAKCAGLDDL